MAPEDNEEFFDAQEPKTDSSISISPEFKGAILDLIQSIARSSKNEKEELFRVMAKKMEEINDLNIDSLALNAEGLKLYENKKEFIEIVKKQIENIEIRDVNIGIIENALKLVQTSALERMRKAAEGDINKSDTRNILDRLHRVKNLHGDERIKEISNIIVLSPIYLIEAIVSILAIGISHLIKGAPKMGEKIGKEAVHYAKNIADTAQFWKAYASS